MSLRLADLLAGLSRLADLGYGLPAGEALRSAAVAGLLGQSLGLADDDVRAGLYTALMLNVGCTGYAHETTKVAGDEIAWNAAVERANVADPRDVIRTFMPLVLRGRSPLDGLRLTAFMVARGRGFGLAYATTSCEVGRDAARRLRFPVAVQHSVYRAHERWNGKGAPDGLAGDDIPVAARIAQVSSAAVLFDTLGGVELAMDIVQQRGGGLLDPHISAHLADSAGELLGQVNATDPLDLVLAVEPAPVITVPDPHLVAVASVFGDLADLKSPYTHGHSSGVAALARRAGERLALPRADLHDLELAGLLHDVGRVAVSNTVWEKQGALTAHEWEQVRLHAYHSERMVGNLSRPFNTAA